MTPHRLRSCARALLLGGALALAGCGGGSSTQSLPQCAPPGGRTARPALPLPPGTVVNASHREGAFRIFEAFVPGTIEDARDFFEQRLPAAGYRLGEGDAEEHEAETAFSGRGAEGRLKLHDLSSCDGAVSLELALRR